MKKRSPSSGQNGQLVHWWLLVHSGQWAADMETGPKLGWLALRKPLAHKSPQGSGRHGIWKP